MKFKVIECIQCGSEFKVTNPKQVYCRPACRTAAHRDRHGYEQPIFKYNDIRALKELREMDISFLRELGINLRLRKEIDKINIEMEKTEDVSVSSSYMVDTVALSKLVALIEKVQDKNP
jgi:hypothetical protein